MRQKPQFRIVLRPASSIKILTVGCEKCIGIRCACPKYTVSRRAGISTRARLYFLQISGRLWKPHTTPLRVQDVTRSSGWGKQYASHILPGPRLKLRGSLLLSLNTSSSRHLIRNRFNKLYLCYVLNLSAVYWPCDMWGVFWLWPFKGICRNSC